MRLTFELTLSSDYHIGAGHGLGVVVDSALLRDGDGVPVLRGSTLEGLLRDGLWRLLQLPLLAARYQQHQAAEAPYDGSEKAAAYCRRPHYSPECPLCGVFGTPALPKRWQVSSARPSGARENLYTGSSKWKAGQTGAQIAARVRVSPRTRHAEARKLFIQEEGDARLQFHFTIDGPDDDWTLDEAALLVAAGRMVRRLGSARRRGRGECWLHLLKVEVTDDVSLPSGLDSEAGLLEHFKNWLNGTTSLSRLTLTPRTWRPLQGQEETPVRRRIIIRIDEPVLLAARAQAGNMFETVDYIQGGTLLGALADQVAKRWKWAETKTDYQDPVYQAFLQVFKQGAVRFSMLYPTRNDNNILIPTIPAPLDLLTCKVYPGLENDLDQHGVHGYAREQDDPKVCPRCVENRHSDVPLVVLGGYVSMEGRPQSVPIQRRQELHPRTDPRTQRVATGNLFGYVALESGQWFLGELWCRNEQSWNSLCQLTGLTDQQKLPLRLGKATRRGYGLVTLWLGETKPSTANTTVSKIDIWRGQPLEQRVSLSADAPTLDFTLTLLSDAIVPDRWGRFYQSFSQSLLEQLLDEPLSIINAYCKAGYVDNFNNQLGLPRWRDIALKAGSAVGIRLNPPLAKPDRSAWLNRLLDRLRDLEENGIGLRRHEGFGQVVFNHPVYEGGINASLTRVRIPEDLQLSGKPDAGTAAMLQTEREALRQWQRSLPRWFAKVLDDRKAPLTEKARQRWSAIARWLHSAADSPLAELEKTLGNFGKPPCLTDVQRETEAMPDNEISLLLHVLKEADQAQTAQLRRRRIQALADYLADLTKEANP